MIAPRGRPQLERIEGLVTGTDEMLGSPRLAAHAETEELTAKLQAGKDAISKSIDELREVIEAWETKVLDVSRARDVFNFHRTEGVAQLGAVLGELRALLGGSNSAAYAYTQAARSKSSGAEAEAEADD